MRKKNWMKFADDDDLHVLELLYSRLNRKKASIEAEIIPKIDKIRRKCETRMRRANERTKK